MFAYRYPRRLITIPALFILGLSALLLLPITLVAAGLLDRGRPWNRARLVLLVTGGLTIEMTGVLAAFLLWLGTGFGVFTRLIPTRRRWQLNRRLMGAYTAAVFWWIAKILGTHIEWRSRGDTITGPVVLMARHTSFFDALIPATVLSHHHGLLAHHVVTSGLRIMPCIDLIGHRFPTRFIRRTPDEDSHELVEIEQLGTHLDGRSAAVIFPEGTFRNPARFERAIDRLRRRSPEIADRAAALRHVLPPRPAGTRALLRG
ncbi:MAG: 1-acyl-sn-glycerol-3-phosphate acyltransferase, partial [Actinomycetota bacterium]